MAHDKTSAIAEIVLSVGGVQVDWEEYYSYYVKTLLRLEEKTILELRTSPHTVSRQIKVPMDHRVRYSRVRQGGGVDDDSAPIEHS